MLTDKSPLLKGLMSAVIKEIFQKKVEKDESIEEFITRRFNKDIANNLISAMVHGIYAGDTKDLSITNTFKILKDYELKYGSIVLGILNDMVSSGQTEIDNKLLQLKEKDDRLFNIYKSCSMYSFDGGIEQLSIKLLRELNNFKGFSIAYNSNINDININDQECKIKLNDNIIKADHIISCIPSDKLYSLLKNDDLSELTYNPSSNVAVVNMLFKNNVMPFHGFGYLVPKSVPDSDAIGVVYDSCPFPSLSENKTNITLMMGGPNFKDRFGDKPTKELVFSKAKQVIKDQLNITDTPNQHNITLQYNCIPQYQVDHHLRMKSLSGKIASKYSNKLFLLGASYNGVAINDCVLYANQLVEGLFKDGILSNNNTKAVYTGLEKFY
ncbi:hypothetical protein K502DRAFT_325103 [Neoconidiobolus thromboides FSU 785]|nr:hypothetical protein K502DRAFT_325103 [Neoconidiobolus thromboides FSU 785]